MSNHINPTIFAGSPPVLTPNSIAQLRPNECSASSRSVEMSTIFDCPLSRPLRRLVSGTARLSKWKNPKFWSRDGIHTQMLHVWYIYLQNWVIFRANVGKYSIHGAYGIGDTQKIQLIRFGFVWSRVFLMGIVPYSTHDGSMVLLYMVTWIPSIYPSHVSIYTLW